MFEIYIKVLVHCGPELLHDGAPGLITEQILAIDFQCPETSCAGVKKAGRI